MPPIDILISAGEASGDMYAARLARALGSRLDVRLFGMGGTRMREAGVDTIVDYHDVSLVGLWEIAAKLPALNRTWRKLLGETRRRGARFAILTDFPGFHLHLSRALKRMGSRNIYFVCPQFWAWRPRRANLVRRRFVRGLCIFPFEVDFYIKRGVPVDWIGHPLVEQVHATMTRTEFAARHGLDAAQPIVTLLPGSRRGELEQHLPVLSEAARRLHGAGRRQFVLALAPGLAPEQVRTQWSTEVPLHIVEGATYDALAAADAAIVSSGTSTVESALLGTPMVVIYRVAPATAWVARRLIRTPFFAMPNLIAGRRVVPELVQENFTPERVAAEAERLLQAPEMRQQMQRDLAQVRERLGPAGAIDRAADIIAGLVRS